MLFIKVYKTNVIYVNAILNISKNGEENLSNYVFYLSRFQKNNINYNKFMR